MALITEVKTDSTQFDELISAITSGSGGWKTAATGVTSFNVSGITAKEFLVIQKMRLPNNTYASTTFIIPKSAMLTAGTMIDGYYYNANYYGTFGVKVSSTTIENDSAWVRMQYGSGTTITAATIDIYYR